MGIDSDLNNATQTEINNRIFDHILGGFLSIDPGRSEFPIVNIHPLNGTCDPVGPSFLEEIYNQIAERLDSWWAGNTSTNDHGNIEVITDYESMLEFNSLLRQGMFEALKCHPRVDASPSFLENIIRPVQEWITAKLEEDYNNWLAKNYPKLES
jgi:hypothetical protein